MGSRCSGIAYFHFRGVAQLVVHGILYFEGNTEVSGSSPVTPTIHRGRLVQVISKNAIESYLRLRVKIAITRCVGVHRTLSSVGRALHFNEGSWVRVP